MTHAITDDHLRFLTLLHQGLIQPYSDPSQALRQLVAVQAQYHESLLVSIWARCSAFSKHHAEKLLWEDRSWIKTWSFRWTLHGFHRDDWRMIVASVGNELHTRVMRFFARDFSVGQKEVDAMNDAFMEVLETGPKTREEMDPHLDKVRFVGKEWGTDMKSAAFLGKLLCAGTFNGKSHFASRSQWLPDLPWPALDAWEAKKELLKRYLKGYAPASMQDFAYWSSLPMATVRKMFDMIQEEVVCLHADSSRTPLYALCHQTSHPASDRQIPDCILLPKFDALLIGYKNRERFISETDYSKIHRPAGHVEAIYLLKGKVAGTWRKKASVRKTSFHVFPFDVHTPEEKNRIHDSFQQLASFSNAERYEVIFSSSSSGYS